MRTNSAISTRSRGQRAGITREVILDAARELPAEDVGMQKLAEVLGVDRRALRHHVGNLDDLLVATAQDRVARELADLTVDAEPNWEAALVEVARRGVAALEAVGGLISRLATPDTMPAPMVPQLDELADRMVADGVSEESVVRGLVAVTHVVGAHGMDCVARRQSPREQVMTRHGQDDVVIPLELRRLQGLGPRQADDQQLEFEVRAIIGAMRPAA